MKIIHDYDKMPPNYRNLYYLVRFKSGKEMNEIVSKYIESLENKPKLNETQKKELELYKNLLPFKYNDSDIHPQYHNFTIYFSKTKRTTTVETRKKINKLLIEKDFIHAHSEKEVIELKAIIKSLGNSVMEEITELTLAEENRIKTYQQKSAKGKRIGKRINQKLMELAPVIIAEFEGKNNFFNKLQFHEDDIGFFITPNIGKDREIITEYIKKAEKSLSLNMEDLDDHDENYFITFSEPEDQVFMRSILNSRFMKEPLEGVKLLGISLPVIIQNCQFEGLNIGEPEWHELDFNEYYESIKKGIFSFNNNVQIKTYSEESICYAIKQLMLATNMESEVHLACYLHFNFLLPIQKYVEKRTKYFNDNDILMPAKDFKIKRENIYQKLILEGKANIKWKNEVQLYKLVVKEYPDAVYQYRANWLESQSLDIYIPSLRIGIEYQGQQHYEPIEFFGGEEALLYRKKLDVQKAEKCKKNNVKLIHWNYKEVVTKTNLKRHLKEFNHDR